MKRLNPIHGLTLLFLIGLFLLVLSFGTKFRSGGLCSGVMPWVQASSWS